MTRMKTYSNNMIQDTTLKEGTEEFTCEKLKRSKVMMKMESKRLKIHTTPLKI